MKQLRFYRPNQNNNGAALAWQLSYKKDEEFDKYQAFLVGANQIPGAADSENSAFDWKAGITVKLGENDLGEILSVLEGRKDSVGTKGSLYHKTPGGGSKVVGFEAVERGYQITISAQDVEKNLKKVYMTISHAEGSLLCVLLKRTIEKVFGW